MNPNSSNEQKASDSLTANPEKQVIKVQLAAQTALDTRKRLQAEAMAIGVSEEYISLLVDTFYERIRDHSELGPVFNGVIQDNWPRHLAKMKLFWSSVALRTGVYSGNPMNTHKALTQAKPEHFGMWLELFKQTLQETAPNPEVVDYFMKFANNMAQRLSSVMFTAKESE